jgi:hypothetical protein
LSRASWSELLQLVLALGGLLYAMGIAALGVVVSLTGLREPTHGVKIWEEVGSQPLVRDLP